MTEWKCPSCYRDSTEESVSIKDSNGVWIDSTIKRCELCKTTFGGTIDDRLAYIRDTYNYKYFGDYELSPEQLDVVDVMFGMAGMVPKLMSIIRNLTLTGFQHKGPLGKYIEMRCTPEEFEAAKSALTE